MSKVICYMDFEFTTTGFKRKDFGENCIELLSIGAVFVEEKTNRKIEEFYEVVRPLKNTKLSEYCIELTKITQDDVDKARSFSEVIDDFMAIAKKYRNALYLNWGNFDVVALRKSIKINKYKGEFNKFIYRMVDLQPRISNSIKYKDEVISTCWGLQKVKEVYNLSEGANVHNALSDAHDLWEVNKAYRSKKRRNMDYIKSVYDAYIYEQYEIDRKRQEKHEKTVGQLLEGLDGKIKLRESVDISSSALRSLVHVHEQDIILEVIDDKAAMFNKKALNIVSIANKVDSNKVIRKGNEKIGEKLTPYKYTDIRMFIDTSIRRNEEKRVYSSVEIELSVKNKSLVRIIIPINLKTETDIRKFLKETYL